MGQFHISKDPSAQAADAFDYDSHSAAKTIFNPTTTKLYYSNGTKETYTININTGEIQNKVVTRDSAPNPGVSQSPNVKVYESPTVDIEALKRK